MSTTAYVCPEHGLMQYVEKVAEIGHFVCTISGCDRFVRGSIEVVPQAKLDEVVEALKRVMRNQAELAEALELGEDDQLSAELVDSREQAKDALGYPKQSWR